jgi:hypothetical protein
MRTVGFLLRQDNELMAWYPNYSWFLLPRHNIQVQLSMEFYHGGEGERVTGRAYSVLCNNWTSEMNYWLHSTFVFIVSRELRNLTIFTNVVFVSVVEKTGLLKSVDALDRTNGQQNDGDGVLHDLFAGNSTFLQVRIFFRNVNRQLLINTLVDCCVNAVQRTWERGRRRDPSRPGLFHPDPGWLSVELD